MDSLTFICENDDNPVNFSFESVFLSFYLLLCCCTHCCCTDFPAFISFNNCLLFYVLAVESNGNSCKDDAQLATDVLTNFFRQFAQSRRGDCTCFDLGIIIYVINPTDLTFKEHYSLIGPPKIFTK